MYESLLPFGLSVFALLLSARVTKSKLRKFQLSPHSFFHSTTITALHLSRNVHRLDNPEASRNNEPSRLLIIRI